MPTVLCKYMGSYMDKVHITHMFIIRLSFTYVNNLEREFGEKSAKTDFIEQFHRLSFANGRKATKC